MVVKKTNTNVKVKKKSKTKGVKNAKAIVVAQEIKFARLLANGDKKVTDKVLKKLQRWLTVRSENEYPFAESDFLRLWKGLFYCMWMSDKPLVQEETAETISKLVHCFKSMNTMLLYTKSTLKSLSSQWFGIDKYRMDKFDMLVRRIIRQNFVALNNQSWNMDYVKGISKVLEDLFLEPSSSLGLILQIIEVFMEELAKISKGEIPTEIVTELVRPFIAYMITRSQNREIKSVMKNIFRYLIFQSDVGLEYQEKFRVWKKAGFPCGSIKDIQKVELSDESDYEDESELMEEDVGVNKNVELDPRAGKVNVELPQIPFDANEIINLFNEYKFHKSSNTTARKQLMRLITEFEKLKQNVMPFGVQKVTVPKKRKSSAFSKRATARLLQFEEELYADSSKNKKRKLSKRSDEESEDTVKNEQMKIKNLLKKSKKQKMKAKKAKKDNTLNDESVMIKKARLISEKYEKHLENNLKKKKKKKKKVQDGNVDTLSNMKNCTVKIDKVDIINQKRNSLPNGWQVADVKPSSSVMNKSLTPVVEKLDVSNTDFLKEILKRSESQKRANKSTTKTTIKDPKSPIKSILKTPTKSPATKVLNPMAMKSASETKKRVKIMLQKNTAQHTSEYFQQLKQSPAIPYDANRKPLTSVLKASPIPSPINPFYKRNSL